MNAFVLICIRSLSSWIQVCQRELNFIHSQFDKQSMKKPNMHYCKLTFTSLKRYYSMDQQRQTLHQFSSPILTFRMLDQLLEAFGSLIPQQIRLAISMAAWLHVECYASMKQLIQLVQYRVTYQHMNIFYIHPMFVYSSIQITFYLVFELPLENKNTGRFW